MYMPAATFSELRFLTVDPVGDGQLLPLFLPIFNFLQIIYFHFTNC